MLLTDALISLQSGVDGPRILFIGGTHGDEHVGVHAIRNMLLWLKLNRGSADFLFGNPCAILTNSRHTDTGMDLNRAFDPARQYTEAERSSYEWRRAGQIRKWLEQGVYDVVMDFHGASPESPPLAICESRAYDLVAHLPVSRVVSGFDDHQPGGIDHVANQIGATNGKTIGVCIECGDQSDLAGIAIAETAILTTLRYYGVIGGEHPLRRRDQDGYRLFHVHVADGEFTTARQFPDFTSLKMGDLIGSDTVNHYAPRDCVVLFADPVSPGGRTAYALAHRLMPDVTQ